MNSEPIIRIILKECMQHNSLFVVKNLIHFGVEETYLLVTLLSEDQFIEYFENTYISFTKSCINFNYIEYFENTYFFYRVV
jgi:hypothetical protein